MNFPPLRGSAGDPRRASFARTFLFFKAKLWPRFPLTVKAPLSCGSSPRKSGRKSVDVFRGICPGFFAAASSDASDVVRGER